MKSVEYSSNNRLTAKANYNFFLHRFTLHSITYTSTSHTPCTSISIIRVKLIYSSEIQFIEALSFKIIRVTSISDNIIKRTISEYCSTLKVTTLADWNDPSQSFLIKLLKCSQHFMREAAIVY